MVIDDSKLREDLIDYFGAAMSNGFPMAITELSRAESASDEELVNLAMENGIDLTSYCKD